MSQNNIKYEQLDRIILSSLFARRHFPKRKSKYFANRITSMDPLSAFFVCLFVCVFISFFSLFKSLKEKIMMNILIARHFLFSFCQAGGNKRTGHSLTHLYLGHFIIHIQTTWDGWRKIGGYSFIFKPPGQVFVSTSVKATGENEQPGHLWHSWMPDLNNTHLVFSYRFLQKLNEYFWNLVLLL